jgi:phage/plasmid-like protein (TIGR03299 family)
MNKGHPMSHELEQFENGQTAFASARLDAWHRLGNVVDHAMTAEEALELAHLSGWNVRKMALQTQPLITADGVVAPMDVPGAFATVRTNPVNGGIDILGSAVGTKYTAIQNEEHVEMLNALVDESGAHFETAGSMRNGTQVFVTMKMPSHMMIGGVDRVDLYIAGLNSHDGSTAFRVMATPVRIVCANTQAAALKNNHGIFTIRHTRNASAAISKARDVLGLTFKFNEEFEAAAEKMIQKTVTDMAFEKMMNQLWEGPDASSSKVSITKHGNRLDTLKTLYFDASTNANIRGTAWAAYQTVSEFTDHFTNVKLNGHSENANEARATQALTGTATRQLKEKAFDLALAMAS